MKSDASKTSQPLSREVYKTLSKCAGHLASFGMYCLLLRTVMQHLVLEYGAGTEVLRMLMGCATALPVEGDRMSSPPPNSVISCNTTTMAQYPYKQAPNV